GLCPVFAGQMRKSTQVLFPAIAAGISGSVPGTYEKEIKSSPAGKAEFLVSGHLSDEGIERASRGEYPQFWAELSNSIVKGLEEELLLSAGEHHYIISRGGRINCIAIGKSRFQAHRIAGVGNGKAHLTNAAIVGAERIPKEFIKKEGLEDFGRSLPSKISIDA